MGQRGEGWALFRVLLDSAHGRWCRLALRTKLNITSSSMDAAVPTHTSDGGKQIHMPTHSPFVLSDVGAWNAPLSRKPAHHSWRPCSPC